MGSAISAPMVPKETLWISVFRRHIMKKKELKLGLEGWAGREKPCPFPPKRLVMSTTVLHPGNNGPGWELNLLCEHLALCQNVLSITVFSHLGSRVMCSQQLIKIGFGELKWRLGTRLKNNLDKQSHVKEGEGLPGLRVESVPSLNSFTQRQEEARSQEFLANHEGWEMLPETRPSDAYPQGLRERRNFRKQCLYIPMSWKRAS